MLIIFIYYACEDSFPSHWCLWKPGSEIKTDSNRSFDKIVFLILSKGLNIALLGRITPGDLQFITKKTRNSQGLVFFSGARGGI